MKKIFLDVEHIENIVIIWEVHMSPSKEGSSAQPVLQNEPEEELSFVLKCPIYKPCAQNGVPKGAYKPF